MQDTNQINIDGNNNITLQNIQGTITINKGDDANAIMAKLAQLHEAQLDALQQIAEQQTERFSDLLKGLLKGVISQKNIVSGSISNVGRDVHVGDTYNFNLVKMTTDPLLPDHYISLSNSKNISIEILERRYLLEQFQQLIDSGKRYIVLHGSDGIGKTTFLSIYYNASNNKKYQQKGWFSFQGKLPETYVQELTKGSLEKPSDIKAWSEFYYEQARREVLNLNNVTIKSRIAKRLIVIDNIHNEEGITDYFNDLLNMDNTIFVFIARDSFKDERFTNFALPRLKDDEVSSIMSKFFSKKAQDAYLPIINGNPFILSLMLKQSPRDAEKEVEFFAAEILKNKKESIQEKDLQIVESLYCQSTLSPLEIWLLLQFAALPNGIYDDLMLQQYWFSELEEATIAENITLTDILELKGYQNFVSKKPVQPYNGTLGNILTDLSDKGWLDNKEGEYELNNLTRAALVYNQQNQYEYTSEIANCLRINFFTEQHDNLKDHLIYEKNLRHYIGFVQGVAEPKYLDTLYKLVTWCEDMGKYYEELHFRKMHFGLAQQYYENNSDFLIRAESDLAWNYKETGDLNTAQMHGKNALQKAYKHLAEKAPLTGKCESHLGLVLKALGDYAGAKALLEKAVRSAEANFGENHPTTAVHYSNLATVLQSLGDYAGAKALLEKATRSDETNFGESHPTTAVGYSNLATVLEALGDYAGAKVLLEKATRSAEANFGENHPTTAVRYSNLALVLKDLGDYAGAKALLEKALRSDEANFGENHPKTATRYSNLALILEALGDYAGAKVLLEKATRSDEANFGENHPTTASSYLNLAALFFELEDYKNAFLYIQKTCAVYAQYLGTEHPRTKNALGWLNSIKSKMLKNGWTEEQIQALKNT